MSTAATTTADPGRGRGEASRIGGAIAGGARWALPAAALAAGAGVLATAKPELAMALGLIAVVATLVVVNPFYCLIAVLAVRATAAESVFLDLATAVGGVVAALLIARRLPMRAVTIPLILLLVIALPSVPLAPSFDEGLRPDGMFVPLAGFRYAGTPSYELQEWIRLAAVLGAAILAASTVVTRARLQVLLGTIVASSLVPIGIALHQLATGQATHRYGSDLDAVRGPFSHPNYFAFYLVVVLTIGAVFVLESRSRRARTLATPVLALALACLLFTYTRSAWIGFALAMLLLAVLRERRLFAGIGLALVLGTLLFPGATSSVGERFGDLTTPSDSVTSNSWAWRTGQWDRMIPHGLDHPLTGEGFGSYSRVTVEEFGTTDLAYPTILDPSDPLDSPRGFTAHNDYVKMLVELGFPGLLLWCATLIGIVAVAYRARRVPEVRGYAQGGVALALALILMSASDHIQAYTAILIYALAFIGGIWGVASRIRREAPPAPEPAGAPTGTLRAAPPAIAPRTG